MTRRISFHVHGRVQGVGYRRFAHRTATSSSPSSSLTGWVLNTNSNTVQGEAQGPSSAIDSFIAELHKGPHRAEVSKVEISEMDVVEGEEGFRIRR